MALPDLTDEQRQAALKKAGIELQATHQARDLGLDTTVAKRRRTNTFKARFVKGHIKARRLEGLVHLDKKARGLFHTVIKPCALWGHQAKGVPPGQLAAYRALMIRTLGIGRRGGCGTTAITLALGPKRDPIFQVAHETVLNWFDMWNAKSSLHMSVRQLWPELLKQLTPTANRWKNVVGPISTIVATLLQFGWAPLEPMKWQDPEGVVWDLDPADPHLAPQFTHHLVRQIEIHLWQGHV